MSRYGERTRISEAVSELGRKPDAGIGYGIATGGIGAAASTGVLADGFSYNFLTFNSTGTLTIVKAGLFDVTLVGGGGGGGIFSTGGGGGGFQQATFFVSANLTVTIGGGGAANSSSVTGATSRFGDFLSCGGGGSCDSCLDTSVCGASTGGSRAGGATRNQVAGQGTGGTGGRGGCGAGGISSGDTGGAGKQINTFIGGASLFLSNGGNAGAGAGAANTGRGGGAGGSGRCIVRFRV